MSFSFLSPELFVRRDHTQLIYQSHPLACLVHFNGLIFIAKICSATMASRFVEANEEFIEELINASENKNTKRSTEYWTNIFHQWAKTSGKNGIFQGS